ncbi:hypothetical protein PP505_gp70 [Gordonia phage Dorito]|uniref:GIY-YIG nuclease family protein n=1 Tax=Gordonia phage Dorito TaxID=2499023 RepID=A0A3S9UAL2_9CAUD|nr:hypothetical protein PP505_gp70 [Gordonia phage Dorito]AZS07340.1 hypothetical protein PBI_DORITO_70 [Gordonia phage Dorito]
MRFRDLLDANETQAPEQKTPVVYYLMVGPATVKIGTSADLIRRIATLRTDMQYIVAVEPGSYELERQRHREFRAERINRREDFRLTERLRSHIEHLQANTYSDEMIAMHQDLATRQRARR